MTKTQTTNYSSISTPGDTFNSRISADTDPTDRNDIDALGKALEDHDHTSGKGLRIATDALATNAASKDAVGSHGVNESTTSASYVDSALAVTFTKDIAASDLLVLFRFTVRNDVSGGNLHEFAYNIDGGADDPIAAESIDAASSVKMVSSFSRITGEAAGSHTITLRWRVSGGTGTLTHGSHLNGQIFVEELKR